MWRYTSPVPLRRIALVTLFAFGCATVRVPATAPEEPVDVPGVIAAPIVQLWIESSEEVAPQLSSKIESQARAAIAEALAGREIPADAAGATDAVLFVRERAVATTEARHSQQTWAKVGIVAAIVVVIAAVVLIAIASKGSGSSGSAGKGSHATAPKSSATPVAVKPRATPAPHAGGPGRGIPSPRIAPPPPAYRPVPLPPPVPYAYGWGHGPPYIWFNFDLWYQPGPLVLPPEEPPVWGPEPPVPLAPDAEVEADEAEPPPPDEVALQLPPLAPEVNFNVEDRGFFAGPVIAIQLDLLDRATGRVLWSKAVKADEDPLDAGAVTKVLEEAFADVAWARRIP